MSYDSKYTGQQVEELLEKAGTALQSVPEEYVTETQLEGKGYATTEAMNTSLAEKVDKVVGKQLTTEDFTTALKQKLEGLSNYDDSEISEAVNTLREDFDTLVSGDSTTAIKTFNEIVAFLSGIEDSESLDSIIASIEQQIVSKQDVISDLATIRSGASKGATAVQPSSLAKVATSGSYSDLSNKPTIPAAVTESTVSGWGFTKNTGTYSKPSSGIPKSDLASAVQTSLGKADSAIQSVKTINGQSIVGSGNISIEGGGRDPKIATLQIPSNAWQSQYNNMMATGSISTAQYTEISNCATLRLDFGGGSFLESVTRAVDNNGNIIFTFLTDNYPYIVSIGRSEYTMYICADPLFTRLVRAGDGSDHPYANWSMNLSPGTFTVLNGIFGGITVVLSDSYLQNYATAVEGLMYGLQFTTGDEPTSLTLPDTIQLPSDFSIEANTTYIVTIFNNLALITGWPNA